MNMALICMGRLKEKYWRDAANEYEKRLSRFGKFEEIGLEGAQIEDKVPLTALEKEQMFVDILPDGPADDGIAYLSFFVEEKEDGSLELNGEPVTEAQICEKEGKAILQKVREDDIVIALCIGGRQLDSVQLSEKLMQLGDTGRRVVFIIGGSLGLSPQVVARANFKLSFSLMTFPHQLARVMLLEQTYRAMKIAAGEKYHK